MEDDLDAVSPTAKKTGPCRCWNASGSRFIKERATMVEKNVSRARRSRWRASIGTHPESGKPMIGALWASTARSCRWAPRTTKRSRSSRASAPRQKMDIITLPSRRSSCSSCRARSARRPRAKTMRDERRPLRPVHSIRREVRVARRKMIRTPSSCRARSSSSRLKQEAGCESHHQHVRERRDSGAERPLRPVRHRTARRTPRSRRTATRSPSRSKKHA